MRRVKRRAEGRPLTERGRFALLWLDAESEVGAAREWDRRDQTAEAWKLADELRGRFESRGRGFDGYVQGASNVLVGLKRRGFAENDGGGAWLSVRWSITEAGHAEAERLREANDA